MKTFDRLIPLACLIILWIGLALFAWASQSSALDVPLPFEDPVEALEAENPNDPMLSTPWLLYPNADNPSCVGDFEADANYYCYADHWAFTHASRIDGFRVWDAGGWGFDLDVSDPDPDSMNATVKWLPETGYPAFIHAEIEGVVIDIEAQPICYLPAGGFCEWVATRLVLTSGWVTDNGIDLSGTEFVFTGSGLNPHLGDPYIATGYHGYRPVWPFEINLAGELMSFGFAPDEMGVVIEPNFFGIEMEIVNDTTGRFVTYAEVPEPGLAAGLAGGILALGVCARRRADRHG